MTLERVDPVIDEVRDIRKRISDRFGNDPARLVAYYIELQERHLDRLIGRSQEPEHGGEPLAQEYGDIPRIGRALDH